MIKIRKTIQSKIPECSPTPAIRKAGVARKEEKEWNLRWAIE
jgi:hypothetical protein